MISAMIDPKKVLNWDKLGNKIREMWNYRSTRENEPGLILVTDASMSTWIVKEINPGTLILRPLSQKSLGTILSWDEAEFIVRINKKYSEVEFTIKDKNKKEVRN